MHELDWTRPGYFDSAEDEVVLQHAIVRYHAYAEFARAALCSYTSFGHRFLDMMAASTTSFFVPTLDIDLAWHTHQLLASQYQNDCLEHVRRYIDQ